jgi:hypothetical protein
VFFMPGAWVADLYPAVVGESPFVVHRGAPVPEPPEQPV